MEGVLRAHIGAFGCNHRKHEHPRSSRQDPSTEHKHLSPSFHLMSPSPEANQTPRARKPDEAASSAPGHRVEDRDGDGLWEEWKMPNAGGGQEGQKKAEQNGQVNKERRKD